MNPHAYIDNRLPDHHAVRQCRTAVCAAVVSSAPDRFRRTVRRCHGARPCADAAGHAGRGRAGGPAAVNKKSWLCWIPYPPSARAGRRSGNARRARHRRCITGGCAACCMPWKGCTSPPCRPVCLCCWNGAALTRAMRSPSWWIPSTSCLALCWAVSYCTLLSCAACCCLCAVCFAVSALWERTLPIPHAPAARSDQRLPPKAAFPPGKAAAPAGHGAGPAQSGCRARVCCSVCRCWILRYYAFSDTALAVTQSAVECRWSAGRRARRGVCKAVVPAPRHSGGSGALRQCAHCSGWPFCRVCLPQPGTSPSHHWLFA